MHAYESLFRQYKDQPIDTVFSHFFPTGSDYDEPFKQIARCSWDGYASWQFHQQRFIAQYARTDVPKLKNYLNYTFLRLIDLEKHETGRYFIYSSDGTRVSFNTGLQNQHQSDLLATFQKGKNLSGRQTDWVY